MSIGIVVVLAFGARSLSAGALSGAPRDTANVTNEQRAAGLTFDPAVAPADRAWILEAIARARPEAQRLIGEIDGMTTIRTSKGLDAGVGVTRTRIVNGDASFDIVLDIGTLNGRRVIDRETVVLHEFGHAVDLGIVPRRRQREARGGHPAHRHLRAGRRRRVRLLHRAGRALRRHLRQVGAARQRLRGRRGLRGRHPGLARGLGSPARPPRQPTPLGT